MSTALSLLAEIRQSSERRSYEVLRLAEPLLNKGTIKQAGDEAWVVYEQIFVAALDEGQIDLAKVILGILDNRFKDSQRVARLHGMFQEANNNPTEALKIYDAMLAHDETNVLAHKRKIALLKSSNSAEAISQLTKYLDTHFNDFEAWLELSHLYLQKHMYPQALFCIEEVILQQPANHFFHLMYAEIHYTLGNLDVALKEFLRVVELSTDNLRGFYGVKLVADRILDARNNGNNNKGSRASSKRGTQIAFENAPQNSTLERLTLLASERIVEVYSKGNTSGICKKTCEEWIKA